MEDRGRRGEGEKDRKDRMDGREGAGWKDEGGDIELEEKIASRG